jgi:1-acyl-sn-glycerol-3-phosphate acyltransferase
MEVPRISAPILRFFRRIVRRYFRRHFHAVRLVNAHRFTHPGTPLIVFANHSSWWDPMVCFLLAGRLMPARSHFAPMEAAALARYSILGRIGIFPIALNSPRGAAQFLRTGEAILRAGGVLWITPQGRFGDARERPIEFKPGLATLAARAAARLGACTLLPLAIEYPFWDERSPECLLRFGDPIHAAPHDAAADLEVRMRTALVATMDALKDLAIARDPVPFEPIANGAAGSGGVFALVERVKALLHRRPYRPDHTLHPQAVVLPPDGGLPLE